MGNAPSCTDVAAVVMFDLSYNPNPLSSTYKNRDGEVVEFEVMQEPNGKWKALNVTGPDGSFVQGAPRRMDGGGFGGGGGYDGDRY
jgi:hypothetical protein|eukprot:scaffold214_cov179-Alexandrium_tamarense.AAC.9